MILGKELLLIYGKKFASDVKHMHQYFIFLSCYKNITYAKAHFYSINVVNGSSHYQMPHSLI